MKIFSNPFLDKKESAKIYSEPFLFEKKIDTSGCTVAKVDFQKPKEKSTVWEAFFEYMAVSSSEFTWPYVLLVILAIIADISVVVISLVGPDEITLEDGKTRFALHWELLLLIGILVGFIGFHLFPEPYKYTRHFSQIDELSLVLVSVFAFSYAFSIAWSISCAWFCIIMSTLVLAISLNIFIGAINAQKCRKLRFDPLEGNNSYKLTHAESKDKGIICIVESSVFKVTIKNIGSEPWDSAGFELHRHTGTGKHGQCCSEKLPQFTLSPQTQIDLIPETADYKEECVRIPNVHCFGYFDRDVQVKTFISHEEEVQNAKPEKDQLSYCSCKSAEQKVTEHVAKYQKINKPIWSNITSLPVN